MKVEPADLEIVVGIPARMGASRFPGKPLKRIQGLTMIEHVYKRCLMAKGVSRVIIATCDEEIRLEAESFGAEVVMTDIGIQRPGLRVAQACDKLKISDDSLVIVVQGDEPLVHPEMLEQAIESFKYDPQALVGTLIGNANHSEWTDPDEVKVLINLEGNLMYMSRSPIPSNTRDANLRAYKQVAVMPFKKSFLSQFQALASTPYEEIESIELLRAIEHGIKVKGIVTEHSNVSVDTPQGLREADEVMKNDLIFQRYKP